MDFTNNQCLFCDLANGNKFSRLVYQTDRITCFLDANPISEGHILVVPKMHVVESDELDSDTANEIMQVSILISRTMKQLYHPDGITIMQNGGYFNDVGHYHLHVFQGYKGDGFHWVYPSPVDSGIEAQAKRASSMKNVIEILNT